MRPLARGVCLVLFLTATAASAGARTIHKSPADTRSYEFVRLANGLEAVVISDPRTDKAAAALDINVGSGSNPAHRGGLAHFLEHMLFLGTVKYPHAGEYKDFIAAHGGTDNAYTSFAHTNYFFTIEPAQLEPALDRFSRFFVTPLFSQEYVERERQVVHSEYTSKLRSDGRRLHDVRREIYNADHPRSRFSVGTAQTLAGEEIRDELIAFYRQHYSAGLMKLVVLGKEPVPTLRKWIEHYFSDVPNTGATRQQIDVPLFPDGMLPARLNVRPLRDLRSVSFSFPIEPLYPHYRTQPVRLVADLIGHEGPGSLLALLRRRGWATGLSAGAGISSPDEATFRVDIRLTKAGLREVDTIGELLFATIRMVRNSGLVKWRYEELATLAKLRFRYAEEADPGPYVRTLADLMHSRPPADLLRAFSLMESFQPGLTARLVDQLDPERVLITVVGKELPVARKSTYYGAAYGLERLPSKLTTRWQQVRAPSELHLPPPNDFIPRSLTMVDTTQRAELPRRIDAVTSLDLWHATDTSFGIPHSSFAVSFRSPLVYRTVKEAVMLRLYLGLVNDQLNEFAYPADLAGIVYSLYPHRRGFSLRVAGYSDREERLLTQLLDVLAEPALAQDRFELIKTDLARSYANARQKPPFRLAIATLHHLLVSPNWTPAQSLAAVESITLEQLQAFVPQLLSNLDTTALSHGNLRPLKAEKLAALVSAKIPGVRRPSNRTARSRIVRFKAQANYLRPIRSEHTDDAVLVYVQLGEPSIGDRAKTALLAQLLEPHFYETMRTEKKLGYVVFAYARSFRQVPGINFVVQSPSTGAAVLEAHVSAFLDTAGRLLDALSPAKFERQKTALAATFRRKDVQLSDRTQNYWLELDREEYDFDSRERFAEAVEKVDRTAFEKFYRQRLTSTAGRRTLSVLTRGAGASSGGAVRARSATAQFIVDVEAFRAYREHFDH